MNNRLQFRHHNEVFDTREDAIDYIKSQIRFAESGLAFDDKTFGYSLFAEPTVLLYKKDEGELQPGVLPDPHLMLVIGSQTNLEEPVQYSNNRFCIIDIDKTEQEIADLQEELEKAIRSLTLIPLSSDTLNFYSNKTEEGTYVSGDVKVAESHIFDDVRYKNNLLVTPEGLFIYVNLEYDKENEEFTFTVSNADDTLSSVTVDISDNYLVNGRYSVQDESLHLFMKKGEEIVIDCKYLIAEWGVIGDAAKSPVILTKEEVKYGTEEYSRLEPWQDVLKANVRIKDEEFDPQTGKPLPLDKDKSTNILQRTQDGRYLFVDGVASNIIYWKNGERTNVKEALDELSTIKLSTDNDNILTEKTDGFFASSKLEYISKDNKLVFKTSGQDGEKKTEIQLNSVELFEHIYYDPTKEALIVTYKDNKGETQFVEIPIGEMIRDWEWEPQNEGHNVKIIKIRKVSGNDKVSADAKIYPDPDNILVDKNHELFVKGTSDNIRHGEDSNVKKEIDTLHEIDAALDNKINVEIARAKQAEQDLDNKIDQEIADRTSEIQRLDDTLGSGFTTDIHETVTYKFNQLQDQVDSEAQKLQNEIDRSIAKDTEHDGRLDAIDAEIGEGFGPRNTVRDEFDREKAEREAADAELQSEIDAVSADTSMRLSNVINEDESIDVETRDDANGKPTVKVVKVNLSTEVEDDRKNIIKLNSDGLFANVDLTYEKTANKLIFHTSNGEPDKEIQLESMSSIISIEYNPTKEAIVITYMTNGHEIKTVEIPVGDLINEWRVEDGHPHAVLLEKVRVASGTSEQDVLKASVIITDDHDDNILVMDDGALYVSGQGITDNKAEIDALKERMTTAEDDIDALEDGLREEASARTLADDALDAKIDQEIEDRIADVNAEEERAKDAELALSNKIDADVLAEKNRAVSAETALFNKIETDVLAEKNRAELAEANLQTAINDEQSRAERSEHNLQDSIDQVTEAARRIGEKLQSEITSARTEEARIEGRLNDEITRSTNKDQELTDALTAETTRATSAETALQTALNTETAKARFEEARIEARLDDEIANRVQDVADEEARATSVEDVLRTDLNREIERATNREGILTQAIADETARANAADSELYRNIADVSASSIAADAQLEIKINEESSARTLADNALEDKIDDEITRSTAEDERLSLALQQEIADREQGDAELAEQIRANKLTFDDTASIDFNNPYLENNVVTANVKLQQGENIIKCGSGLYATVNLSYDPARNTIKLVTSNGEQEAIQLNTVGSLIDAIEYDATNRALVVKYHDAAGNQHQTSFPVNQLFNDWIVDNPSEKSAIKLVKTAPAEPDDADTLSGFVLITDDRDGDGKPDEGSDNLIEIRNNGLYVCGSAMTEAEEIAECVQNEVKVLEKAVIGHQIGEECGSGYTYEPNAQAKYINSATSFYNADYILDQNLDRVEGKVDDTIESIDCVDNKADKLYQLLYGATAPVMPNCGSGITYQPYVDACVISAATSFMEADQMLNDQICELLTMWVSGLTCTNESQWVEDGANRKIQIYTRLSRGKYSEMTDDDIFIEQLEGPLEYIDPTNREFTDTNVLRIACINEGPSGTTPSVASMQNGIYLSNEWDCGLYYGPSDTEAKEKAEAAGYRTDPYSTDETSTAHDYNYMNNVRITPPQS